MVVNFVRMFSHRMGKKVEIISAETMSAFQSYSWPGNIRELRNLVERAVILSRNGVLSNPLRIPLPKRRTQFIIATTDRAQGSLSSMPLEGLDHALILDTLEQAGWIVGGPRGAAAKLGLKRTTLLARMRRMGITRPISKTDASVPRIAQEDARGWGQSYFE